MYSCTDYLMKRRSSAISILLLLTSFLCFTTSFASGAASFDCQTVWDEPSDSNDIVACITSGERAANQWPQFIFPSIIALTFVILILVLPFICCCCCTSCCCANKRSELNYCKSILIAGFAFAGAVCSVIFLVTGGISFQVNYLGVMNEIENGPLQAMDIRKDRVETYLTDYSTNPPTPPDLDLGSFDTLQNDVVTNIDDLKDSLPMVYVVIASSVLGGILLLLSILALAAALCRCRNCACCCGWLFYLIAVIMCLVAVGLAIVVYVISGVCGETLLQEARLPGMFQWYFLPLLESSVDFEGLNNEVRTEVTKSAMKACAELLAVCDPDELNADPTKPFVCGNGLTTASQCQTIDDLVAAGDGSYVKPSLASTECPSAYQAGEKCTLKICAEYCVDSSLQSLSADVSSKFDYAENTSTALSYLMPLLEPNFVLDEITSVLVSEATSPLATYDHKASNRCADIRVSAIIVEVGFYVSALMLLIQLYVLIKTRDSGEADVPDSNKTNPLNLDGKDAARQSSSDMSKSATQEYPVVSEDRVKSFDEPPTPEEV